MKFERRNSYLGIPEKAKLIDNISNTLSGEMCSDEPPYSVRFFSQAYFFIMLDLLMKLRITPKSVALASRLYFSSRSDERTCAIMLIDKQMHICDIRSLTDLSKSAFADLSDEISDICSRGNFQRLILIYNFKHGDSVSAKLFDFDRLYRLLRERRLKLIDAIEVTEGTASSIMLPVMGNADEIYK